MDIVANNLIVSKRANSSKLVIMLNVCACLISLILAPLAHADDELLNTKPNLMWLSDDINVSVFGNETYDSFLGTSEIWTNNWGISAKLLQNDNDDVFGLPADSQYFNFDVKRRILGSQDKSNLELGLGWQELDIASQLDASGPKVSLSGRFNILDSLQLYGATSYFPELEDNIQNSELTAFEFEAGLSYKPVPSLSFKAGYRVFSLDLEDPIIEDLGSSSGFLIGTDLSW
jgi:opacity protein-like surface antigen